MENLQLHLLVTPKRQRKNFSLLNSILIVMMTVSINQCNELNCFCRLCAPACLNKSRVKGKILVCGGPSGYKIAKSVGAIAIIDKSPRPDVAFTHHLPASGLKAKDFKSLVSYIESQE